MLLVLVFFAATFAQSDVAATVSSLMDWSVDPCDDFWLYSCGSWIKNTTLPPTKPRLTRSFTEIGDHNQEILKGVVEDPANSLLNTFFNSCMDMDSINAAGTSPLQQQLALLPSITDLPSLFAALAQLNLVGISPFFNFGATIDPGVPSRVTISFEQGGLGLPYPSLYSAQDDGSRKIREAYSTFLQTVFTLLGDSNPAQSAAAAYQVEAAISAFTVPRDQLNDPFVTYNPMSFNYFQQLSPLPWGPFLDAQKISVVGNITVSVPAFYQNISRVIPHLQNQWIPYLKSAILRSGAPSLSQPFRDAYFNFYSKVLGGQSQPEPLWRQCIARTDGLMGELTGKYFLQLAFPGSSLSAATEDLQGIIKSMQDDIINIPWMDSVTRSRALQKLSLVVNMIGGPAKPRTYDDVIITTAYFQNVVNLKSSSIVLELKTIGQDSQGIRNDWQMSAATVNAYYDPTRNQMVFPAGILQQPFFNNSFPIEMNLGGIGMVMGHELTHGFDNQGRLYDGTGRLTNWWQPDTSKLFDKKVQCVIDQYSQFQPLPGVFVNGKLTQGENIADMGGIKNAFSTVRTMLGDAGLASPSIVPKLVKGQLFFVAFAQTWCTISSPEYLKLQVQTDPHSPAQYRVLGPLINLPEFSQTFSCPVGSRMNPPTRCEVW